MMLCVIYIVDVHNHNLLLKLHNLYYELLLFDYILAVQLCEIC
jgi:hypothetical protein